MDLDTLKSFIVMSETGSLSEAAEKLFLSPSALASRIKKLEEEVGQELFVLKGRTLELSGAGKVFLPYAMKVISLTTELQQEIEKQKEGLSGTLTIATTTVIASYILPKILQKFREHFKHINLRLIVKPHYIVHEYLNQGIVDVGITDERHQYENQEDKKWLVNTDLLVVSYKHPWASKQQVKVEELTDHPLIAFKRRSEIWSQRMKWIEENGGHPWISMELNHAETVKEILLHHYGYAFLPQITIKEELDKGLLKQLKIHDAPTWRKEIRFVFSSKKEKNDKVNTFVNFVILHSNQQKYLKEMYRSDSFKHG